MGAVMVGAGAALLHGVCSRDAVQAAPVAAAPVAVAPVVVAPVAAVAVTVPPVAESKGGIDMAPVLVDGGLRVLLPTDLEDLDDSLVVGAAEVKVDEGVTVVTRRLRHAAREMLGPWVGERLRLYSADGSTCLARITKAVALGRFDDSGSEEPADPEEAWARADGTQVVAGDLEVVEGECEDPIWARSASLPEPTMATRSSVDRKTRSAAIAAFKARPEHRELTDGTGDERYEVKALRAGGDTIVVTTLVVEGCAGEWPALTGLWRLEGDKLTFLGARETMTDVLAAADADGDGRMDLVTQEDTLGVSVLRRRARGAYRTTESAPVLIHGCRC